MIDLTSRFFTEALVVLLSIWLGITLFVWWSATGTFEVLSAKKNPTLAGKLVPMQEKGRESVLRHAAGEVNRRLFRGWNLAQLALGVLALVGASGMKRARSGILLPGVLTSIFVIVLVHTFWLSPEIEASGRALDFADRAREEAAVRRFGYVHGAYVISDMLKATMLAIGLWISVRRARI